MQTEKTDTEYTFTKYYQQLAERGNPPPQEVASYLHSDGSTVTKEFTRNPGWKTRIRRSELVHSDYSISRVTSRRSEVDFMAHKPQVYYDDWGNPVYGTSKFWFNGVAHQSPPEYPDEGIVDIDALDQTAIKLLSKKTRERYEKLSGLVVLGELKKTLQMVASPARALRKALSAYLTRLQKSGRKMRGLTHKQKLAAVNQEYLAATYGWSPLISDVSNGAQALAEMLNRRYYAAPVSTKWLNGTRKLVLRDQVIARALPWYGLSLINVREVDTVEETVKLRYWSWQDYSLNLWKSPTDLDTLGISFSAFVPSLWELLPWSFVVDYFTNIGDILAHEFTDWSHVQLVARQVRRTVVFKTHGEPNFDEFKYWWGLSNAYGSAWVSEHTYDSYQRLKFEPSSLKLDFSLTLPGSRQSFNLSSLAAQLASTSKLLRS